jgi:hypothetical protein
MNEIGSVEFEAHVPLFFDPYSSNRATGSFILIDPFTNATVGAGMIQEDASATQIAEGRGRKSVSHAAPESQVTAQERHARHGHSPAVLLLEGRPALAAQVERLLFDHGFEVIHLRGFEFSGETLGSALRLTQLSGIIAIYSGDALAASTKHHIAAEFHNRLFDLTATPEPDVNDEQIVAQVLAFSRSLWLAAPLRDQERIN